MLEFERNPHCPPPTVLLAEDDPGHARLIQSNLRESGIKNPIQHFEDGAALLDFLHAKSDAAPALDFTNAYVLLLDIRMPKVSGDEALAKIKEHSQLRLIPVVMLTTTDDPKEIRRCFELGCNQYVTKPVDYDQFVTVIQRLGAFLQITCVPVLGG
ncbi:MAG: response regulator [Planctomycetes bacterium]|nr:response regulator [Planctomycetota bacterium]